MDAERAEEIAGWSYPPPYDIYDGEPSEAARMTRPETRYSAVLAWIVGFGALLTDTLARGLFG